MLLVDGRLAEQMGAGGCVWRRHSPSSSPQRQTAAVVTIAQAFLDMPRWWSDDAGRQWLQELPELVIDQCRRWHLQLDGRAWHGSNAFVVPVRRRGDLLALRMSPPGDDVASEARALRFWNGHGTVQLVETDPARSVTLLERLDGSRSLLHVPLDEAVLVLADIMVTLAVPAPHDVLSTHEIAAAAADDFVRDWKQFGQPTTPSQLDYAVYAARAITAGPSSNHAVNGDLHYQQVLAGTRAPWLVVDPVLLQGDLEYDLGRILWTRLDEMTTDADVRRYFDVMVDRADLPEDRARDWVVVRSMGYLLWGLRHGLTTDPVRCQRLLHIFA